MSSSARAGVAGAHPVAEYDAVLLAGGGARRLGGVDKPGVEVGGRALVELVAEAVGDAHRLILVGPPRPGISRAIVTRERPAGAGPVPALAAGLVHVAAGWVAVLAADLPFLRRPHVDALRAAAEGHRGAVLVDAAIREQWLIGVWQTATLRTALQAYDGASLRGLLGPLNPRRVTLSVAEGAPPPWLDCDTMGDVTSAKEWDVNALREWTEAVCLDLDLDANEVDRGLVLDLARDVAHSVARPAAPLTAYLAGLAVGRGADSRDVAARITDLAESWGGQAEPSGESADGT